MVFDIVFFAIDLIWSEFLFRLSAFGQISDITAYMIIFLICGAGVFALICNLFGGRVRKAVRYVLAALVFFYYAVVLVYQHIFKSFLSVSQVGMGADAISTYTTETLFGINESKWFLIGLLLPIVFLVACGIAAPRLSHGKRFKKTDARPGIVKTAIVLAAVIGLHFGNTLLIRAAGTGTYSPYDIYNDTFVLGMSQKYFGSLTSTRLEVKHLIMGTGTGSLVSEGDETPEDDPSVRQDEQEEIIYNTLDYDFAGLADSCGDERTAVIHNYFASKKPTAQNEYTGMFKDYNLITLVCESYSPYLLDEERTPMLYKMAHEGFIFSDFYDTICDNTNNSEYVILTSLLPDTSLLGKGWDTFYEYNSCTASKNNYFPFCIGTQMRLLNRRSLAFHYYYGSYYGRKETHPNFGYEFYYMLNGMKYTDDWPTSDLDMMKQALPRILTPNEQGVIEPFNAYFLTFSGHMYYRFDSNRIARVNKSVSDGLPFSEPTRAYVSCNQELEYAVEYLVDELEKAGVLDNTLILITPDHYPYTLGLKNLSELAGKDLQSSAFEKEFNQYRGTMILWNSQMTEPVYVDEPCCTLDILPTLSNLFGLEFDSRLMMGTDIFSDSEHIAILQDRSFITKDFYYNASDGSVTPRSNADLSDERVERLLGSVKNKFFISTEILYTDYYRKLE